MLSSRCMQPARDRVDNNIMALERLSSPSFNPSSSLALWYLVGSAVHFTCCFIMPCYAVSFYELNAPHRHHAIMIAKTNHYSRYFKAMNNCITFIYNYSLPKSRQPER